VSSFAKWRFSKHELPIEMVYADMTDFDLPDKYDVIFSDAVWEHLDTEMQLRYASKLPTYVNENGLFIFLVDLAGETPEMPMHYDVDIVSVHNTIEQQMDCLTEKYKFASVWRKRG
jgi:cyclopropane fatty-acyl-phospholipid synthase-like methyltransferase